MISIKGHKLHVSIDLSIPLPFKYRGGGVAVFRISNGTPEVLLGLRANNPGRGLWSFPGGAAEGQEKLHTAAVREFKEETGVQLYGRYITRVGLFKINTFYFDWNTLIIESTQKIDLYNRLKPKQEYGVYQSAPVGEFISIRWVPLVELENYKLHRWVMDVVDFYESNKMKVYVPKPPAAKPKPTLHYKKSYQNYVKKETGASLLFDMAEMVLTKIDPDGTKYFKPKNQIAQEALYGV